MPQNLIPVLTDLLRIALPELLSQTATTGKQFAQLLIRVWQKPGTNFPRHRTRGRELVNARCRCRE
jgi:hypothetical protein